MARRRHRRLLTHFKDCGADVTAATPFGFAVHVRRGDTIYATACCRGTLMERKLLPSGTCYYNCDSCGAYLPQIASGTAYAAVAGEEAAYFEPLIRSHGTVDPLEAIVSARELEDAIASLRTKRWGENNGAS